MVRIFDMGEQYADRYTVVYSRDMVRTMSYNATSPNGFCQWADTGFGGVAMLKGKSIKFEDAPNDVQVAIQRDLQWISDWVGCEYAKSE